MPSRHPVNSTIDQVLFSFFSVNFFWCFHMFKNCYSHVFQAMSWFVKIDSSSFSWKYTRNVSFMFWKVCCKASFSFFSSNHCLIMCSRFLIAFQHSSPLWLNSAVDTLNTLTHYHLYCPELHSRFASQVVGCTVEFDSFSLRMIFEFLVLLILTQRSAKCTL